LNLLLQQFVERNLHGCGSGCVIADVVVCRLRRLVVSQRCTVDGYDVFEDFVADALPLDASSQRCLWLLSLVSVRGNCPVRDLTRLDLRATLSLSADAVRKRVDCISLCILERDCLLQLRRGSLICLA